MACKEDRIDVTNPIWKMGEDLTYAIAVRLETERLKSEQKISMDKFGNFLYPWLPPATADKSYRKLVSPSEQSPALTIHMLVGMATYLKLTPQEFLSQVTYDLTKSKEPGAKPLTIPDSTQKAAGRARAAKRKIGSGGSPVNGPHLKSV
jgi:hypothetical protein